MSTKKYAFVENIFSALIKHWKLDDYKGLAAYLDVPYQTLMAWKKRDSIADYSHFMDKGISKAWLETGEGSMFSDFASREKDLSDFMERSGITDPFEASEEMGRRRACQTVDIYNMVSGGPGAVPTWHEAVDRRAIPTTFLKPHIRPVLVRGRSMEPTFKNGAIIGVDEEDKQVIEGEAYAIVLPYSGAAVKRLYPLPDGVLIRSDNKEFPEVTLKKEDIPDYFILGRVCWVVQEV